MIRSNLKQLVSKLNDTCRRSLEGAAGLCLSRSNYNVEVEHWLMKLLEDGGGDLACIFRQFDVDTSRLSADLNHVIDRFKTGNSRAPSLSQNVLDLIQQAWLICSVDQGQGAIRTGHLLCALTADELTRTTAATMSREFEKISPEMLRKDFDAITAKSQELGQAAPASFAAAAPAHAPVSGAAGKNTPALDQYTVDVTAQARAGKIDPVLGRDEEIRQIIDILSRRRQNNPILTGEPGVGKTAVVEGFALRIVEGDVPPALRNVSLRSLDLGLLQAGAGIKGEFENRLKSVIDEVRRSPTPIILFIDEAHTMIGAGGQNGQGDAANLLKPALARGELRTVAATTWAEYKKYFEKDAALTRRFQVVKVEEPSEEAASAMLRGLANTLERHHQVRILDQAVVDAVRLSSRYITGRQLPDKAISVLDTTCARIGISQTSTPPAIEDCRHRLDQAETLRGVLEREIAAGVDHADQMEQLEKQIDKTNEEMQAFEQRWQQEKELVDKIQELHRRLEISIEPAIKPAVEPAVQTAGGDDAAANGKAATADSKQAAEPLDEQQSAQLRGELRAREEELRNLQGESPLVYPCVDPQAVAATISSWTGIPLGRMVADEVQTVLHLKNLMGESIIGQDHALDAIAQRIRTSRANLSDPNTPIGVFLLAGSSGVGKTESAITLANLLYGGSQNMTTINMSEFKEEHKVSLLMGSPPGYVGYGEGGVLTEAVRRKPYSVVLLDEMEKAHSGVQDIFYQVFDKGNMKDGEGRDIDFRNTVVIMTSNVGTDLILRLCSGETWPSPEELTEQLFPELMRYFKPAFLGRLTVVPFYPLDDDVMQKIVRLKLNKIARRVGENYHAEFAYTDNLVGEVTQRCTEVDTGARNVDHILTQTLLPEMSAEFLSRLGDGEAIKRVSVDVAADGKFAYDITTDKSLGLASVADETEHAGPAAAPLAPIGDAGDIAATAPVATS
ncbi:MAG: type VI secretion system ATPase TssH [Pirellulaceae bacterium]